jgi:glycosyltransferase involved in cell wall biosynthesis
MKKRLLIVWSGAANPAYQGFFNSLANVLEVHVIGPSKSKHGSVTFAFPSETQDRSKPRTGSVAQADGTRAIYHPCRFITLRHAFYFIPAWLILLWRIRPHVVYWMDEGDRISTTLHLMTAKWIQPQVKTAVFGLQNILKPGYYRPHHSLAWYLNRFVIDRFVAATEEAQWVARQHGLKCPSQVIPLFADEGLFHPPSLQERTQAREQLGIQAEDRVLAYAGTLHAAKGLFRVMRIAVGFERIRCLVATGEDWPQTGIPAPHHLFHNLRGVELRKLYHAADAVILASEGTDDWKEQFGRILVEGSFSGCLAMGSDSGAIPGVLGNAALVFQSGNDASLRKLLDRWQAGELEPYRENQRQWIRARFSIDAVSRQTIPFLFPGFDP